MNTKVTDAVFGLVLGLAVGIACMTLFRSPAAVETEAIKRGFAYREETTQEFTWHLSYTVLIQEEVQQMMAEDFATKHLSPERATYND